MRKVKKAILDVVYLKISDTLRDSNCWSLVKLVRQTFGNVIRNVPRNGVMHRVQEAGIYLHPVSNIRGKDAEVCETNY